MERSNYIFKCGRCGKRYKVHKLIYRLNFDSLDIEDFRPWSRLGVDLCFKCNKEVENFIFGSEEEMTEIQEDTENEKDLT